MAKLLPSLYHAWQKKFKFYQRSQPQLPDIHTGWKILIQAKSTAAIRKAQL